MTKIFGISDTSTTDYFNGRSGLKVSMDTVDYQSPQQRKPLTKLDSIDIADCESKTIRLKAFRCR